MPDSFNPKPITQQDTSSIENKIEDKTLGPVYMVYRDNRNWEKYAPKIIEHIQKELGGHIEVQVFPRGTDEGEIKKWYEENQDKFGGKFMLTDTTCKPVIESGKYKERISLDHILEISNKEVIKEIFRNSFGEKGLGELNYSGLENIENSNTKIFKLALENNTPSKITLVESRFGHHSGFLVNLKGLQERSVENDKQVLESYKKWLLNAGYPETNISIVEDIEEPNKNELESMKKEWFFIDNHNPMADKYRSLGLNVINPSEISDTVKPSNNEETVKFILSGIDENFKKISSIEEFISIYGSDPKIGGDGQFEDLMNKIGNKEKFLEIMYSLIDLNKNNQKWKGESRIVRRMLSSAEKLLNLDEESKEKIKKRIEEVMNN